MSNHRQTVNLVAAGNSYSKFACFLCVRLFFAKHSYALKTIKSRMTLFSPQFRVEGQDMPDAQQALLGVVKTCQMRIRQCQLVIPEHFNAVKKSWSLMKNCVGAQLLVN